MAGTRPMLFSIAVILVSGFTLVHDLIRYGREYGPNTEIAQIGMMAGLLISLFGVLYGASATGSSANGEQGE
ncbi:MULTISPECIES: hypothetical protein [Halorussus]|uniref:hypothetical protein n=1 Tax=Halorussus TaxID=1070314 RepID=UPI00209EA14D|nr:hypothetical protein [Halorussus vallis]USZ77784.1 hypothetical protein NGM07_21620 [Halorussus vallis]